MWPLWQTNHKVLNSLPGWRRQWTTSGPSPPHRRQRPCKGYWRHVRGNNSVTWHRCTSRTPARWTLYSCYLWRLLSRSWNTWRVILYSFVVWWDFYHCTSPTPTTPLPRWTLCTYYLWRSQSRSWNTGRMIHWMLSGEIWTIGQLILSV